MSEYGESTTTMDAGNSGAGDSRGDQSTGASDHDGSVSDASSRSERGDLPSAVATHGFSESDRPDLGAGPNSADSASADGQDHAPPTDDAPTNDSPAQDIGEPTILSSGEDLASEDADVGDQAMATASNVSESAGPSILQGIIDAIKDAITSPEASDPPIDNSQHGAPTGPDANDPHNIMPEPPPGGGPPGHRMPDARDERPVPEPVVDGGEAEKSETGEKGEKGEEGAQGGTGSESQDAGAGDLLPGGAGREPAPESGMTEAVAAPAEVLGAGVIGAVAIGTGLAIAAGPAVAAGVAIIEGASAIAEAVSAAEIGTAVIEGAAAVGAGAVIVEAATSSPSGDASSAGGPAAPPDNTHGPGHDGS